MLFCAVVFIVFRGSGEHIGEYSGIISASFASVDWLGASLSSSSFRGKNASGVCAMLAITSELEDESEINEHVGKGTSESRRNGIGTFTNGSAAALVSSISVLVMQSSLGDG